MNQFAKAVVGVVGVALVGWVAWGVYTTRSTASVAYERLRRVDGVELRRYPQTVLVETTAPDQRTAFRRLFEYISGANEGEESIAMTAPVETSDGASIAMTAPVETSETDTDDLQMAFYLPDSYGPETAPEPSDPAINLRTDPPRTVAVRRFSWYAPDWRVERQGRKLLETLDAAGIDPRGSPSLLRYNDPWTPPFMRRNEVAVGVDLTTG